ncbi:MAG: hypothetical protein FJW34_05480 [Acidobacteria bacterium]|nr:hypothetical protein [Acidobacteriota bacterium]
MPDKSQGEKIDIQTNRPGCRNIIAPLYRCAAAPLMLLLLASAVSAQIVIRDVGRVVDAASYSQGIAPGSLFVVKDGSFPLEVGLNLSPLPLQQSLRGVSVVFAPAGGGEPIKAWMLYTYNGPGGFQLAGVLPSTTPPGNYSVSVITGAETITNGRARVVERKYRSLSNSQDGLGLAVVQNYVSSTRVDRNMFVAGRLSDGQTKSPASPGQTVILWGLGLGAIRGPDNEAPGVNDLRGQLDVKVAVGGVDAPVQYAGRSPQFPGIDQINFTVPQDAPAGCNVALQVTVNGEASNAVTMAIAPPGKDAWEHPLLSREQLESLDQGSRFLAGEFNVMVYVEPYRGSMVEIHSAIGYFNYMTAGRAGRIGIGSIAPGRCTLVRGDSGSVSPLDATADDSADGGRLTVSGPSLPGVPLDGDDDYYYRLFSVRSEETGARVAGNLEHQLKPGDHTLRGAGGAHVGPFEATLQLPEFLKWTNRDTIRQVVRDEGVTVQWSGGGSKSQVIIQGGTARLVPGSLSQEVEVAAFICAAPPGSTSFTVPAPILRSIPAATDPSSSLGLLIVAAFSGNSSARFEAALPKGGQLGSGSFGSLMMVTTNPMYR